MGPPNTIISHQRQASYHDNSSSSSDGQPSQGILYISPDLEAGSESQDPSKLHVWADRMAHRVPSPIRKASSFVVTWVKGPDPPRIWKINPYLPSIQTAPIRLLDRWAPKRMQRFALLMALYFCWLLCFVTILHKSAFSSEIAGYGSPSTLSCTDTYWTPKNGCGIDGDDCRPFENSTLAFRCPANCLSVQVLNPHAVGTQEINYRSLVIGGPNDTADSVGSAVYRGDSFICSSAIHSGFITNTKGGCGVVSLIGTQSNYPSVNQHDIESIGFDSDFPLAFKFLSETSTSCEDLRWPLLATSIIFSVLLSLFTTSPSVLFFSLFCGLFFHTALVSDPPSLSNYYDLVSNALGGFLPAAFCGFVIYKYCVHRTLDGLQAQVEKTVLWLGPCWIGCLNNYTFDKIPIQRLTPHDIKAQPGGVIALVIIVVIVFCVAVGQVWAFRIEGRLPRYLALYAFMGFCLVLFIAIPNMSLRIHHYILALLLLPGTAMQNRPSLIYQGLLVGLFINGIARWGFDSILQTPGQLLGDGQLGSDLPSIVNSAINANNISFSWGPIADNYDGMSILVNDVERFRGYEYDGVSNFTWERQAPAGDPEYFRFGYMSGSDVGDYTMAGTWAAGGEWIEMRSGPSK